jgi:hypothetical protein
MQLSGDSLHRENYGDYGIGLTKEWGIENRVSPVIYVHEKSQPSNQLYNLIKLFRKYSKEIDDDDKTISGVRKELVDSFKFIKPYQGRWHKGKKIDDGQPDIIYYNEREWRYCPVLDEYRILSGIKTYNKKKKDNLNSDLRNDLIKFRSDDIKFIVIKSKSEIDDFVLEIKKMKISPSEKNKLITNIISFEEIKEDY